jgi:hypothetical protein
MNPITHMSISMLLPISMLPYVRLSINQSISVELARFKTKFNGAVKAFRKDVEKKIPPLETPAD